MRSLTWLACTQRDAALNRMMWKQLCGTAALRSKAIPSRNMSLDLDIPRVEALGRITSMLWLGLAARQSGNHRSDAVAARDDVARRVTLIDRQEAERLAEELGRAGAIKP